MENRIDSSIIMALASSHWSD